MRGKVYLASAALILALAILAAGCAAQPQPGPPVHSQTLHLDLPYIQAAWVARQPIKGYEHKTLCVRLDRPMPVLSTLEGWKRVIRVANHYVPPPAWRSLGMHKVPEMQAAFWRALGFEPQEGAMLITGADMANLAIGRAAHGNLRALALVTAGVRGNAMRLGADQGRHVEHGTINMLIFTNRRLSPRAMTRALITATEAKTAALQDLDVRSSYEPVRRQATGTGTDNIIVVQGAGAAAELTGGHSKLGELIARAVYQAVLRAIAQQNGIVQGRAVALRLAERKMSLKQLAQGNPCQARALESLLSQPRYGQWVEQALALQDAWLRGQLSGLVAWRGQCRSMAAGLGVRIAAIVQDDKGPLAMVRHILLAWAARQCPDR